MVSLAQPTLSVIIPTFNRGESLNLTLGSIVRQQRDVPCEIIVVDNNSTDFTKSVVLSHDRVRYILEERQGLGYARNSGIKAASGDVIVLVDDDVLAEPNWLAELQRLYADVGRDAWCVGGRILLDLPLQLPVWFREHALSGYLSGLDRGDNILRLSFPDQVFGANFSISRSAVDRVGHFRADLDRTGECLLSGGDSELCWRILKAGGGVYYNGRASVRHIVSPSRLQRRYFRRRAYWQGRTDFLLGGIWGSTPAAIRRLSRSVALFVLCLGRDGIERVLGQRIHRARRFEQELTLWREWGYLQQAILCGSVSLAI